jgi:glyoxylase-like metal-dependent hydrolase (beta-lactamase superfamily II)
MAAASMLALRPHLFAQQSKAAQDSDDQTQQSLLQSMRVAASTATIEPAKLTDTIFLVQSVGANILVHTGPDGQLLIDSGMATATPHLLDGLKKLGPHPLKLLVNTSWLFDHTDGNAALHAAGAFIIAQENVRTRLSAAQKIPMLNLDLPSAPASALPQATFTDAQKLYFDNDEIDLVHAPNASTDSDIFVHFVNANVIHAGELWFNDAYPIIETVSGGTINGMIQGVDQILQLADERTKIVPSHGKPGNKTAIAAYRETLADVANRVEKLKIAGQTLQQVLAAKVTADLDAKWGRGEMTPEMFLSAVYNTL